MCSLIDRASSRCFSSGTSKRTARMCSHSMSCGVHHSPIAIRRMGRGVHHHHALALQGENRRTHRTRRDRSRRRGHRSAAARSAGASAARPAPCAGRRRRAFEGPRGSWGGRLFDRCSFAEPGRERGAGSAASGASGAARRHGRRAEQDGMLAVKQRAGRGLRRTRPPGRPRCGRTTCLRKRLAPPDRSSRLRVPPAAGRGGAGRRRGRQLGCGTRTPPSEPPPNRTSPLSRRRRTDVEPADIAAKCRVPAGLRSAAPRWWRVPPRSPAAKEDDGLRLDVGQHPPSDGVRSVSYVSKQCGGRAVR